MIYTKKNPCYSASMAKLGIILLFILQINLVYAQQGIFPVAAPASVNFSDARLKRIDTMLQQYINEHKIAGVTALIARDGKMIYNKAFGYADIGEKETMSTNSIFRIASQTKAVTCVAIMMLCEEGKFSLDEPISKFLPAFAKPIVLEKFNTKDSTYTTIHAKREITIRDLLTHTSGIDYPIIGTPEMKAIYQKAGTPVGFESGPKLLKPEMDKLAKLPLRHQPGESYTYGLNMDVLGYLIETVSGINLKDFFQTRIFNPLGMKDTYFYLPKTKKGRLVSVYVGQEKGNVQKWQKTKDSPIDYDYPLTGKGTYFSGGAGLSGTIGDYAKFCQMLLNGGTYNGVRLLSKRSVELMTMNQIGELDYGRGKLGLGFGLISPKEMAKTGQTTGSFYWAGYFGTIYWIDPQKRLIGLLYIQQYPLIYDEMRNKFKFMIYQALND